MPYSRRAPLALVLAGLLPTAVLRAQVENTSAAAADRQLQTALDDPTAAGATAAANALATLTEVFTRLRARPDLTPLEARELVIAAAVLADREEPAAIAFLPAAITLCEHHGFDDRRSQLITQHVMALATAGSDALLAFGVPALDAIERVAPEFRHRSREGLVARLLVEDACRHWHVAAAEAAVQFLDRSEQAAADPAIGRELRVLRDSARAHLALLRGEPERALADLTAVESELASTSLPEPSIDAYLRVLTPLDRVRYQLGNDQVTAAIRTTRTLLATMTPADPCWQLLQLGNGTALLLHGDRVEAENVLRALVRAEPLDDDVRLRAWERLGRLALQRRDPDALADILNEIGPIDDAEIDVRAAILGLQVQALRDRGQEVDRQWAAELRDELLRCYQDLLARADQQPREFGGIGFLHFEDAHQVLADLVDATLLVAPGHSTEQAFAHVLAAQARGSLSRMLAAPDDLASVRAMLPPRSGFVVYVPSRHGSHLFFGDQTSLQHERLPDRDSVERAARDFGASLLGGTDPEPLWQRAKTTRELLLPAAALAAIAGWDGVCVSGVETLGQVPFEALRLADDRLLGEATAVTNQASLPLGVVLARRRAALPVPRKLLFVPELNPPLLMLTRLGEQPGALPQRVIEPLMQPFAMFEVVPADGRTPAALAARDLRDFDVIHLLAHGWSDASRRFGHGLCLAADATHDDGILWPEEVLQWHVRGLVILSACQAGRAPRRVGEDHASNLGGAFLFAGAAGVVQSRGRLQTDETLALTAVLHQRLAAGDRYAEALRAARASRSGAGLAARFHAAQIQLLGP